MSKRAARQIPIQERAFAMGDIVGVNAYRVRLDTLQRRLSEGGYHIHATPHFMLCRQPRAAPGISNAPTLLIHWFAPAAIDSNLGHYMMEELKPPGLLANQQHYGDVLGAIVNSVCPRDPEQAWHLFATNTLQRLRDLMASDHPTHSMPDPTYPIEVFAALYRRVQNLCAGASLLDAGCSSGFLPLLLAERLPTLTSILGVDISPAPFAVARTIAQERHLPHVHFKQADLLSDDLAAFPLFDTVTLLHVLEHFSEPPMYHILSNLLRLTARRLIIAVPYEADQPEPAYGHQQLFTREKLLAVGRWCIQQWGHGSVSYENCAGGLIWVDRNPPGA
jgi:SAM-dependent methyltransferase